MKVIFQRLTNAMTKFRKERVGLVGSLIQLMKNHSLKLILSLSD